MNGLRLASMPASDMLDVIHYFFEDDANYASPEQAKARSAMRTMMYRNLYGREYEYAHATDETAGTPEGNTSSATMDFDSIENEILDPSNPFSKKKVTPYSPPTVFNPDSVRPFGTVLDEPLG